MVLVLTALAQPARAAAGGIQVFVNGQRLSLDVSPVVQDGRTLVPLRAITEGLGAEVDWDGATGTVTVSLDGLVVTLTPGRREAAINGRPVLLDVAPANVGGRTLVPLRFIGEAFGAKVGWYGEARVISVSRPERTLWATVEGLNVNGVITTLAVRVERDGTEVKDTLRLIGVQPPGLMAGLDGVRARDYLQEVTTVGTRLLIELDEKERDPMDRLTAYAYLPDGRMLNALLAEEGIAQVMTKHYNNRYDDLLKLLENSAHVAGRGLWPAYDTKYKGLPLGGVPAEPADLEEAILYQRERERQMLCEAYVTGTPEELAQKLGRWPSPEEYENWEADCAKP